VTKSGTNEFTATFYFLRDDAFRAEGRYPRGGKPARRRHQFSFAAGGPIKKDKIFFFVSFDQQLELLLREHLGPTFLTQTCTAPAVPRPGTFQRDPDLGAAREQQDLSRQGRHRAGTRATRSRFSTTITAGTPERDRTPA
jgi:hypothetical protein